MTGLKRVLHIRSINDMPMTLDQILEEAQRLPPDQVAELVDRLSVTLHSSEDPSMEDVWKQETRRRLAEIESGRVSGIPGEEVSARVRKIVGR